ncbi:MAG: Uma2 family endonuclease, partial [Gloeomargarita sp. SKYB31]|nr:Uma2 family endonuclease [Gloeomargarita sp. SKYB31]
FALYRTINTLQEYLLIDQYRVSVEHYRKTAPNQWLFSVHQAKDETVTIASVGVEIELNKLYEGIL